MRCRKNDSDARPTFSDFRNKLKNMETLHKMGISLTFGGVSSSKADGTD